MDQRLISSLTRQGFASDVRDVGAQLSVNSGGNSHAKKSARRDAILLILSIALVGWYAGTKDALEAFLLWARAHEDWELDEILTMSVAGVVGLTVFSLRRVRELHNEILERNSVEDRLSHLAMHDPLTGLPNRTLFFNRLQLDLHRSEREGTQVAVFALDIDLFKRVNDVYGHATGDALLVAFAQRLRSVSRLTDTVARLSGDEFAICQPGVTTPEVAMTLASRILHAMEQPFELDGHKFLASTSIGISMAGSANREPMELLRAADVALYRSKSEGRSTYRFFDGAMDEKLRTRQTIERALRQAVVDHGFELHYQPLFSIHDQKLMGFEALIRWEHPELGRIPPDEFIPIAEEIGLIGMIGNWVLHEACNNARNWDPCLTIAINVSPIEFRQPDIASTMLSIIDRVGMDPSRVEIEITEGVLMHDTETVLAELSALKARGVKVAMDDFGTGYSSLSYLRKFAFDKIKIDRVFVRDLEHSDEDVAIVRAMVAIGTSLGMKTLAEGVETDKQLSQLASLGCQDAQGFLLGRPMTLTQVDDVLSKRQGERGRSLVVGA